MAQQKPQAQPAPPVAPTEVAAPVPPGGAILTIQSHGYTAEVASVGATLKALRYGSRNLVTPFGDAEVRPCFHGAVLAPWPNRIANGAYRFEGVDYQLPITEVERSNAIHGLVAWVEWQVVRHESSIVELCTSVAPQPGYPGHLELRTTFALHAGGLEWTVRARNIGSTAAPYGVATHPYLQAAVEGDDVASVSTSVGAGNGIIDAWRLYLPAAEVLESTPDRLLPRDLHPVDQWQEGAFDFRQGKTVGGQKLDHAYTGMDVGEVRLLNPAGWGVKLSWDTATLPWVQAFTSDLPGSAYDRSGVAVEAMSCPPDAFNSGQDVEHLAPGASHSATWHLAVIRP